MSERLSGCSVPPQRREASRRISTSVTLSSTAGRLVAEMDAREDLLTPFGNLHGGCLSAFVDHCLGVVFYPVIPKGAWVATTEFKLNLLRPVSSGVCVAVAEIISLTKRSGVARIDITNDGKGVCAAQGTVTIVLPKA